jgi:hypothetical protein
MMKYYVGILPSDRVRLVHRLEELRAEGHGIEIQGEYDDPHGYYTFLIGGTLDTYHLFLQECGPDGLVRSITYDEY